jgi:hypothetical protein
VNAVGRSESTARTTINDRIHNVTWGFGADGGDFVCECERSSCSEKVWMKPSEYVRLRDRGDSVYAPGHDDAAA